MAIAMFILPIRDGVAKYLSADYSPLFIAWCSYLGSAILILPIAWSKLSVDLLKPSALIPQLMRTLFLVAAFSLFLISVSQIPLADALGAYLISPIIGTLLAAIFLKERLTRLTVFTVIAGFIGALLIIRPGVNFNFGTLYAVASGISFGCYLAATRNAVAIMHPVPMLLIQNVFAVILLLPSIFTLKSVSTEFPILLFMSLSLIAVTGHLMSVSAFRFAPASVLSPIVYMEIVSGVIIGYLMFNDLPTPMTWGGIFLICVSGLLLMLKGQNQNT